MLSVQRLFQLGSFGGWGGHIILPWKLLGNDDHNIEYIHGCKMEKSVANQIERKNYDDIRVIMVYQKNPCRVVILATSTPQL